MSSAPKQNNIAIDNQNEVDNPKMIVATPKPATAISSVMPAFLNGGIATMAHPETAEVVGGWIDGERAHLRIKGRHAYGQTVRGRVEMKNDGGVWKVGDNALR